MSLSPPRSIGSVPVVAGPIPVTATSVPFRSALARESSLYVDLPAVGYVEEEWFLDGIADAVDPDGTVLAVDAPYTTRVLVRRPHADERFSGAVFVEPFHNLNEDTPAWTSEYRHLIRNGHAWVGLTVNSGTFGPAGTSRGGGVAQLRAFDPERYGALHLLAYEHGPTRAAPAGPGGFDPELMRWRLAIATAQGHAIAAGLFALLKGNDPSSPLAGLAVDRVYATGWSQTGLFLQQFLDRGYHEAMGPVVDGYLIAVGPAPEHRPADAVLVNLLSEGEVVGTLNPGFTVADDTDTPRFRGYEVPGSFHHWEVKPGAQRQQGAGHQDPSHDDVHNDRPWHLVVHAILDNLDRWVRDGVLMPRAPRITRDPDAADGIARDEDGNARGGLRTPWLDVPTARYAPRCTCSPVTGTMTPLTDAELHARYPDHGAFVDAWECSIDALVADRWLLASDADALRADPAVTGAMDGRTFLGLEATEHPHHWRLPVLPRLTSGGGFLFGGCGLGAACEAMELTTGRPTVWATAQYLAFARPPSAVDIEVLEPVTGHFTSQARAIGRVDGEEIFTVNAAMGLRPHELEGQWVDFPDVPAPDDCEPRDFRFDPATTVMGTMELRVAKGRPISEFPGAPGDGRTAMWARFPNLGVCTTALAILGDLVGFGVSQAVGDWSHGSSLDNTVRIVRLVPTDWILLDIRVHGVANGYAHGNVHLWTRDGQLLGTASQSTIARKPVWISE